MVRTYESLDDLKGDGRSCGLIRDDLKHCIYATDCVRLEKRTPRDCLASHHPSVPEECHQLRNLLYECKRSLMDFRSRFRGRKGDSSINV